MAYKRVFNKSWNEFDVIISNQKNDDDQQSYGFRSFIWNESMIKKYGYAIKSNKFTTWIYYIEWLKDNFVIYQQHSLDQIEAGFVAMKVSYPASKRVYDSWSDKLNLIGSWDQQAHFVRFLVKKQFFNVIKQIYDFYQEQIKPHFNQISFDDYIHLILNLETGV